MTDSWGEAPRPPAPTGPLPLWLILTMVGGALLVLALLILPGLSAELDRDRAREIRVCELSKVMSGETDAAGAELLCARSWER